MVLQMKYQRQFHCSSTYFVLFFQVSLFSFSISLQTKRGILQHSLSNLNPSLHRVNQENTTVLDLVHELKSYHMDGSLDGFEL